MKKSKIIPTTVKNDRGHLSVDPQKALKDNLKIIQAMIRPSSPAPNSNTTQPSVSPAETPSDKK